MNSSVKLTMVDLTRIYGVSLMTVNNWRKGSKRKTPLPFHTELQVEGGTRSNVYFFMNEVKEWAKANQVFEVKRNG